MPASSAWRHTGSRLRWLGEWSRGQPLGTSRAAAPMAMASPAIAAERSKSASGT